MRTNEFERSGVGKHNALARSHHHLPPSTKFRSEHMHKATARLILKGVTNDLSLLDHLDNITYTWDWKRLDRSIVHTLSRQVVTSPVTIIGGSQVKIISAAQDLTCLSIHMVYNDQLNSIPTFPTCNQLRGRDYAKQSQECNIGKVIKWTNTETCILLWACVNQFQEFEKILSLERYSTLGKLPTVEKIKFRRPC